MYQRVDVKDKVGDEEPEDICGYLGQTKWYRQTKNETSITEQEFLEVIKAEPRLTFDAVIGTFHEIDKDNNGYVTKTEMDDILKLKYPEHFDSRDLMPIIKKF